MDRIRRDMKTRECTQRGGHPQVARAVRREQAPHPVPSGCTPPLSLPWFPLPLCMAGDLNQQQDGARALCGEAGEGSETQNVPQSSSSRVSKMVEVHREITRERERERERETDA